ncbi:hypothetical protein [Sphaerospermopsis torques-reginae]|uniref:Uncharacterized protein n=1 Tax=Sphaerospermopsis torques-reginae ITEP-024 TaxID=984208 RepID=A0ABX8WWL8_9CYAN|nr:hypothetical protein [Sphaerospermopsis torques-reginae]QYX30818.1 hypothetical protein K2F26_18395 [Sphaerospermopsis torques-reginae ITEP-024]
MQRQKQLSTIRNFLLFYIGATVIIIVFGYLVGSYREIEEYKKITSWYEKLDDKSSSELSEFIQKAQQKLESDFILKISNPNLTRVDDIHKKIIIGQIGQNRPGDASDNSAKWEIKKGETVTAVYYGYVGASNFSGKPLASETTINTVKTDQVFLKFADKVIDIVNEVFKTNSNKEKDLNSFTKAVMMYLGGDDKYIKSMPYLRINNIYITNLRTGFLLSYPLTDTNYEQNVDVDFKKREWFTATPNGTATFNKENPKTGLTDVYIDINDRNAMRTLFYTFKDDQEQEYILCIDLFIDKSSEFSSKSSLDLVKQYVISGLYLEEDNNPWLFLILYSLILAVFLFLVYEMKAKYILLRMLNFNVNNLSKIKVERNPRTPYNASSNIAAVKITITGMTGQKNESETSTEAGWKIDFNQLQANVGIKQTKTQQREFAYNYELSNEYNLDITQQNLTYRRVETWEVKFTASNKLFNQTIGHFVVTWKASDTEKLHELLEIKSVYWEKDYESYLDSIKLQLREHLLTSDAEELVPVMDTNYSIHQNIPQLIRQTESLKKLVHNSLYLKEGRIAFSEIQTLQEVYQSKDVEVKAICTIDFLKNLSDNQLQDFFRVKVGKRYFIEYKDNEFRDFYNKISENNVKDILKNSNLQIIVYTPDQVIIGGKDDFCVISIQGTPKFIAYSFTDDKYHNIGWISWRGVDVQFYDELYKAKIAQEGTIQNITNYLGNI